VSEAAGAGQADLARLRAPWDPVAGRYRAPDEKTIRVVLDRLDPRALTRALLGPRPHRRRGGPSPASVRGYPTRRASQQAKALARGRLRAVAAAGETSRRRPPRRRHPGPSPRRRRARRAPAGSPRGRRQAQRDQPLHRAPGTPGPRRRRGDLRRPAHRAGEPELAGRGQGSPLHRGGEEEPAAAARPGQGPALAAGTGRRRHPRHRARPTETRTLKAAHVSFLDFPGARQAIKITRRRKDIFSRMFTGWAAARHKRAKLSILTLSCASWPRPSLPPSGCACPATTTAVPRHPPAPVPGHPRRDHR
jgi:hypothetical protein